MHKKTREEIINNYIFTVQVLFSLMSLIIIFKYFGFESYNFFQAFIVTFLIIVFLISIGYLSIYLGKQNYHLDFAIILLNFLLITFLFVNTSYFELRFLYLIPIIISAIKFNLRISVTFSAIIGIVNLLLDLLVVDHLPLGYTIETDLMFAVIYVIISWLLGIFVKIEDTVRNNLYKTQEKLIKQSSLLQNLINEMPLCILVIDKQENIVHINQVALDYANIKNETPENYIGFPLKQYINKLFPSFNFADLLILDTLHNGKSYFKEKIIRNNKLIEFISQPIYDQRDSIIYAMAIFYDVTSEELINERIKNLERLNLVGQMGASIAHEIKNPLTTIKGFLQLAQRSKEKLTDSQLDLLISEIERCNAIIIDFLSISKKSSRTLVKCDLKNILEKQLILIEREALLSNVYLRLEIDEAQLFCNENEIKQLILNLTHNAIEAMPKGGNLYIRLKNNPKNIILQIEDEGEGIPEEILDKVSTPFVTTKQNGTGLGLSVCYQIAESHGATIVMNSKKGIGTTVTVTFPKCPTKELEP
ncbi:MAG: two-component system, sporulation sensor kinase [Clostridia bacterium]|jgi:nitrogen-specific signal transduction histidine kinase|nr:two-component system, sporulation sensor kinase [Clostridia bacterium]MDN5322431.1 two-component system, sporulation sensor kinase [Clostridia bacterium]